MGQNQKWTRHPLVVALFLYHRHYYCYCFRIKMSFCLLPCKLLLLPYNIFTALGIQTASNNISNVCCYSSHITQRLWNVMCLYYVFSKIKRKTDKKMIMCDILTRTFHMTFMTGFYSRMAHGWLSLLSECHVCVRENSFLMCFFSVFFSCLTWKFWYNLN